MIYKLGLMLMFSLALQKDYAQTSVADSVNQIIDSLKQDTLDQKIYKFAQKEPHFPGNKSAWLDFVKNNIDNSTAKKNGAPAGIYRILTTFVVDKNGSLRNFVSETRNGFGMENEVIRVLKLSPRWIPAINNGYKIHYSMRLPVSFVVAEN